MTEKSNTGSKNLWALLYELYGPQGQDIVIHFKDVYKFRAAQELQKRGFGAMVRESEFTFTFKRTLTNFPKR